MDSAERLVQEVFTMVGEMQTAAELLRNGRAPEAQNLMEASLKRFHAECNRNSTIDALATLMQGFKPPTLQTTGLPAMHNPMGL